MIHPSDKTKVHEMLPAVSSKALRWTVEIEIVMSYILSIRTYKSLLTPGISM